jgi:hypothetical protein
MTYSLISKFYNQTQNLFFETAPENASLLGRFAEMKASISLKHNYDFHLVSRTTTQESDGTWVYTITSTNIPTVEDAETRYQDQLNASFWQDHIFEWNKNNNVKSRTEIVDSSGNLVKLLHDNRSIGVAGSGPSAWAPYVPA